MKLEKVYSDREINHLKMKARTISNLVDLAPNKISIYSSYLVSVYLKERSRSGN